MILTEGFLDKFVQDEGWLQCGIPLVEKRTCCSQKQLSCHDSDLIIVQNRTLSGVRDDFTTKVVDGFYLIGTWIASDDEIETVMFLFRTYTGCEYLKNEHAIPVKTIE